MAVGSVRMRPMRTDDIGPVVDVFQRSLRGMRVASGLPAAYDSGRLDGGVAHLLGSDPDGSWVAESEEREVVGFAQAAKRDELWVLCHLFVDPAAQSVGIGRGLVQQAFAYGDGCASGLIAATPMPAAITLYARLPGFVVHPMVSASGEVRREGLRPAPDVQVVQADDREVADAIDRIVRGGAHGTDIAYLLAQGSTLLSLPGRGYAVVGAEQVDLLAATDLDAAEQLLAEALRQTRPGTVVSIKRIGASQPWATRMSVEAGLRLSPLGPLVTWNCAAATSHYLADSAFC